MSDFYSTSRSVPTRRNARGGYSERDAHPGESLGSILGWAIFLLLLAGLAAMCWLGTIYIFGHPEQSLGYEVLKKFKKIEAPKRFSEIGAPEGEFLDAKKLMAKYGQMTPLQLQKASDELLRNYIRNYQNTGGLVPYVVGRFTILDSYELKPDDFFPSGVVALAQNTEAPNILIEQVFPADASMVPTLFRSLLTGLEIPIRRSLDLSPIIHVERLPDGRLKFTTVPIQYPDYSSSQGPGSFSLEPPAVLNVKAGLPVLTAAHVQKADEHFAEFRRKLGRHASAASSTPQAASLMPVRAATTTAGGTPLPSVAHVESAPPASTPPPAPVASTPPPAPIAVAPAQGASGAAPTEPEVRTALPVTGNDVQRAEAVATPAEPAAVASAPTVGTNVPLKPFMSTGQTTAVATTTSGKWPTYKAGQMPQGRLINVKDGDQLAGAGLGGDRVYLSGNFSVSAAGQNRAVLRSTDAKNTRIIVEYPTSAAPPGEGSSISRGSDRPFLVTRIERGADGTINIWAREVTSGQ